MDGLPDGMEFHIKQEPLDPIETMCAQDVGLSVTETSSASYHNAMAYVKYGRDIPRVRDYTVPQNSCEVCQGEFVDRDMLQGHKLLHFNTSHVCYLCDCYFVSTDTLIMHMATLHRSLKPDVQGHKNEGCFICSICVQRFSSNKNLLRHHNLHTAQDNSYGCKICGLDFIGYRALLTHLNSPRHKEMKVKIQSIFVCVDCRSIFASRDSYAMHMMVRAQNESCDMRKQLDDMAAAAECLQQEMKKPTANLASPWKSEAIDRNPLTAVPEAEAPLACSPLNLSSHVAQREKSADASARLSLPHVPSSAAACSSSSKPECSKCREIFGGQEELAIHVMGHVQEETLSGQMDATSTQYSQLVVDSRPSSAPIQMGRSCASKTHSHRHASGWMCSLCSDTFEHRDALAMHVMDKHANDNSTCQLDSKSHVGIPAPSSIDTSSRPGVQAGSARGNQPENLTLDQNREEEEVATGSHDGVQTSVGLVTSQGQSGRKRQLSEDREEMDETSLALELPKRCRSADSGLYQCKECGLYLCSGMELTRHMFTRHVVDEPTPVQCSTCNMVFYNERGLQAHLRGKLHQAIMDRRKYCHLCGHKGQQLDDLVRHVLQEHGEDEAMKLNHLLAPGEHSPGSARRPQSVPGVAHAPTSSTQDRTELRCNSADMSVSGGSLTKSGMGIMAVTMSAAGTFPGGGGGGRTTGHAVVDYGVQRRSKRKPQCSAKMIGTSEFTDFSDNRGWLDEDHDPEPSGQISSSASKIVSLVPPHDPCRHPPESSQRVSTSGRSLEVIESGPTPSEGSTQSETVQKPSTTSVLGQNFEDSEGDIVDYILSNAGKLIMCKYCKIIYTDQTMYYLHMGLHNLNNPWQCNLCGKVCVNVHEFTSHVIHY